jgi:hypothetical protein
MTLDVLVIGGGNAALCAALMAREAGASVMLLESAPIYRIVMFVFAWLGGTLLAPNGEPVNEGALFRTLVVLALLTFGYCSSKRLRQNLFPLILLGSVLAFSLTLLPWSLGGAPKW